MYGNAYQNGPYFEVWDSKVNVDKNLFYQQLFKLSPSNIKKYFDKQIKSYLYGLYGQNSKIVLPADDHKQLALHQKYLVLHLNIPIGQSWSMEIGITDINNFKRRINLTTVQGKQEVKYFSLRYPVEHIEKGCWLFLAINVYSFMEGFKDTVFRSLDHITVGSNCRVRRIFTMKEWNHWEIPKNFWFANEVSQEFQLIQYKEQFLPKIGPSSKNMHISEPVNSLYEKLTPKKMQSKIALGKSQLYPNEPIAKSKLYNHHPPTKSPHRAVSLEPIVKKSVQQEKKKRNEPKIRLNSLKDQAIMNLTPDLRNHLNDKKNLLRMSHKKKPIVQKSFQEDDVLPPRGISEEFQTSNQSNTETKEEKKEKKFQKWSQEQDNEFQEKTGENGVRTVISKQNKETVIKIEKKEGKVGHGQVQLIYDDMVGCYYHPETNTYFEIKK